VGDAKELGKNVGDDLAEGKPTLPLIYAMQHAQPEQIQLIRQAIRKSGTEELEQIIEIVQQCGAIDYTNNLAREHVAKAKQAIAILDDSPAKQALAGLADLAVERTH